MKRMLARGCLLVLALVTVLAFTASAQSLIQQALQQQLDHKAMVLRAHYACPTPKPCTLVFNRQGQLQNKAAVAPISLGVIYVDRVKFRKSTLVILANGATIVRMNKSRPYRFRALVLKPQKLKVKIPYDSSHPLETLRSLHAIFSDNIEQALNEGSPQQRQANLEVLPLLVPETKAEAKTELKNIGRKATHTHKARSKIGPTWPKPIYMVDPRYTKKAIEHKVHGKCLLAFIVNTQGFPQNIRILKPLRDGLDEQAIGAISQYRFRPAMKNGKPVPVHLIVEVDFHIG